MLIFIFALCYKCYLFVNRNPTYVLRVKGLQQPALLHMHALISPFYTEMNVQSVNAFVTVHERIICKEQSV